MKKIILFLSILLNTFCYSQDLVITSAQISPGQDIQPVIKQASETLSDGSSIILPTGQTYIFNGSVLFTKKISIVGNFCKFTRGQTTTDADLNKWGCMISYQINERKTSGIQITNLYFESKSGGSATDGLLKFINTEAVVTGCTFTNFGNYGITFQHYDNYSKGLIYNNHFGPCRGLNDLGYGVVAYGENLTWIKTVPSLKNILTIENNVFDGCRHAFAGGGNALYIADRNLILENYLSHGMDAHEKMSETGFNKFPSRFVVWSNNTLINKYNVDGSPILPGQDNRKLSKSAGLIRGGEAVVYGNVVIGYRDAFGVIDFTAMAKGTAPSLEFRPKVYHWDNTYTPYPNADRTSELMRNYNVAWYPEVYNYPKPGYNPEIYPNTNRLK